jgi:hypothetical protein
MFFKTHSSTKIAPHVTSTQLTTPIYVLVNFGTMGKYSNKINLVVFNILIWHFYQIHKLIDGIAIDVYVIFKKFS